MYTLPSRDIEPGVYNVKMVVRYGVYLIRTGVYILYTAWSLSCWLVTECWLFFWDIIFTQANNVFFVFFCFYYYRGDHSSINCNMAVLPPQTEAVVFSIDGSFLASYSIRGIDPKIRGGAVDVVRYFWFTVIWYFTDLRKFFQKIRYFSEPRFGMACNAVSMYCKWRK